MQIFFKNIMTKVLQKKSSILEDFFEYNKRFFISF